ncbi:MAG: cysteine desulfurase SufS [Patescibacteria group bacterium]
MFGLLNKRNKAVSSSTDIDIDGSFGYLEKDVYYFDSACQTLRPIEIINAEKDYYYNYNACGHRVKYEWGKKVDKAVDQTREDLLKLAGKTDKEFTVAFSLNATSSMNMILHQLNVEDYDQIITTEWEHSSVFLPSLTWAKRNNKPRLVLTRDESGKLIYELEKIKKSILILNSNNNFDGRSSANLHQLVDDVKKGEGVVIIDGCQTFGHHPELLEKLNFDAACGSGHKMYGPSIGFAVIRKQLVRNMDTYLIGGSTIADNSIDQYELIDDEHEMYARLEPGLQNFAGIIGLGSAIRWRRNWVLGQNLDKDQIEKYNLNQKMKAAEYENWLAEYLNKKLQTVEDLVLLNSKPSSVVSVYFNKLDSNRLGQFVSEKNIMARTGYHCCYYYLKHLKDYPALFRVSLGLQNTPSQIDFLIEQLQYLSKLA